MGPKLGKSAEGFSVAVLATDFFSGKIFGFVAGQVNGDYSHCMAALNSPCFSSLFLPSLDISALSVGVEQN